MTPSDWQLQLLANHACASLEEVRCAIEQFNHAIATSLALPLELLMFKSPDTTIANFRHDRVISIEADAPFQEGQLLALTTGGKVRPVREAERPAFVAMTVSTQRNDVVHVRTVEPHDVVNALEQDRKEEQVFCQTTVKITDYLRECRPKAHVSWERDFSRRVVSFRLHCDVCRAYRQHEVTQSDLEYHELCTIRDRVVRELLCCPTYDQMQAERRLRHVRLKASWRGFVHAADCDERTPCDCSERDLPRAVVVVRGGDAREKQLCVFVSARLECCPGPQVGRVDEITRVEHYALRPVHGDQILDGFVIVRQEDIASGRWSLWRPTDREERQVRAALAATTQRDREHLTTPYWNPMEGA